MHPSGQNVSPEPFDLAPLISLISMDLFERGSAAALFQHLDALLKRGPEFLGHPEKSQIAALFSSMEASRAGRSCPEDTTRVQGALLACWPPWVEGTRQGWGWFGIAPALKAAAQGYPKGLDALLTHPSAPSASALSAPLPGGQGTALQILMRGTGPGHVAPAIKGALQRLLKAGVDPNVPFVGGGTALAHAPNTDVAACLVTHGGRLVPPPSPAPPKTSQKRLDQLANQLSIWEGLADHDALIPDLRMAMPMVAEGLVGILLSQSPDVATEPLATLVTRWRSFGRKLGHDLFRPPPGQASLQGLWARASVQRFRAGVLFLPGQETSLTGLGLLSPLLPHAWSGADEAGVPWAVWGALRHLMEGKTNPGGRINFETPVLDPYLKDCGADFWPRILDTIVTGAGDRPALAFFMDRLKPCLPDPHQEVWHAHVSALLNHAVDKAEATGKVFINTHWSCLNDLGRHLQNHLESLPVDTPGWTPAAQALLGFQVLDGLGQTVRFRRLLKQGGARIDRTALLALVEKTRGVPRWASPGQIPDRDALLLELALPPPLSSGACRPRM